MTMIPRGLLAPLRKSVRNRLAAVFLLVILVPMSLAALADMYIHLSRMEEDLARHNMDALAEAQNSLLRLSRQAEVTARHLADMAEVRDGMGSHSLVEHLEDTREIWFLGLVEVFDRGGNRVAVKHSGDGDALRFATAPDNPGLAKALDLTAETDFHAAPEGLCIKAFAPVLSRSTLEVLGAVVVTYPITGAQLKSLKDQVRADFVLRWNGGEKLHSTFVDQDGGEVARGVALPAPETLSGPMSLGMAKGPGGNFATAVVPLENNAGQPLATLASMLSDKSIRAGIRDTAGLVAVAVALALALALALGVLVANSFTRPILLLHEAMAAVGRGRLDTRVRLDQEDELGRLAEGFNAMAERLENTRNAIASAMEMKESYAQELEATNERLARFNQELESTVELRTREISLRNLSLTREIEERQNAERQLKESEQRFMDIIDFLPDATFVIDREGRILAWNRAMEELTGVSEEQMLGKGDHEYSLPFYGERRPALIDLMLRHDPELEARYPSLTRVGNTLRAEVSIHRLRDRATHLWAIATPLFNTEGEIIGAIESLRDITDRVKAQQKLAHHAFHDMLTGLANRALMTNRLEHALRRARRSPRLRLAVLLLDLDRFKRINDTLGHMAGDSLLVTIARRLEAVVRDVDTVARLGGDEFVILLDGISAPRDAIHIAQRILEDVRHPVRLDGHEIVTSASIGIVFSGGEHQATDELLRDADLAMYRAKELGRGRYKVFHTGMRKKAMHHLSLEGELRHALETGQFALAYQPIVDMHGGQSLGLEALLRWRHPERGLVEPTEFLEAALESGLMPEIGAWVLRRACLDFAELMAAQAEPARPGARPLALHVNLSGRELAQPDLPLRVAQALSAAGLGADRLVLEITETEMMADPRATLRVLEQLHQSGVRLALDDFGTGVTSLATLRQFPINMLKVDASFMSGLAEGQENRHIVQAIVSMARGLGLGVMAEGVETEAQRLALLELGCGAGQGYRFAAPELLDAPGQAG